MVTGGSGFLGVHLVQELLKGGAKVRVPIHHRPLVVKDPEIETVQADLTQETDCLAVVKGVDYVFHAAGVTGSAAVSPADSMGGIATNLVLGARMLHAAWAENIDRFLLVSSSTVYPPADYPIKEEEAWSGPTYSSYVGYGWMKRYLEKLAEYVAAESKVKIAIVRPTAPYGRWDDFDPATSHVIPALIKKALERLEPFEVWGSGEEVRDFLHISDLARGCLLALEKHATCDPLNIGYGQSVSIKELVGTILNAAGHDNATLVFNSTRPTTAPIRMVDTSKATRILGFQPDLTLEEGIRDTVNWYEESQQART